jgi:hypothetical protein
VVSFTSTSNDTNLMGDLLFIPPTPGSTTGNLAQVLEVVFGVVQASTTAFILVMRCVVIVPLVLQETNSYWAVASTPILVYSTWYFLVALLSVAVPNLQFIVSFLLLDVVVQSETATNVVYAVVYPRRQLGMAAVLAFFVVFIFSWVYFLYFAQYIPGDQCNTLLACLVTVTNQVPPSSLLPSLLPSSCDTPLAAGRRVCAWGGASEITWRNHSFRSPNSGCQEHFLICPSSFLSPLSC